MNVRRAAGSQDQAAVQRGGAVFHRDGAGVVDVVGLIVVDVIGEGVVTSKGQFSFIVNGTTKSVVPLYC